MYGECHLWPVHSVDKTLSSGQVACGFVRFDAVVSGPIRTASRSLYLAGDSPSWCSGALSAFNRQRSADVTVDWPRDSNPGCVQEF